MNIVRFIRFLFRHLPGTTLLMLGAGAASGLASAGVLATINRLLHRNDSETTFLLLLFAGLVIGKLACQALAQLLVARFAQDAIISISLSLSSRVASAPLAFIEKKGHAQLLATLTDDVSWVVWALQSVPQIVTNGAVLVGCGVYLGWLSWIVLAGLTGCAVTGAIGYQFLHRRTFATIYAARDARAALFLLFRTLLDGGKELLMHRGRRDEFVHGEIGSAAEAYRRVNLRAAADQAMLDVWAQSVFYFMIGLLMAVLSTMGALSLEALTGYVFVLLYAMSPIWGVIGAIPTISRGQVAVEKIEELGGALSALYEGRRDTGRPAAAAGAALTVDVDRVMFRYDARSGQEQGFELGPVTLRLTPGEVLFIVGGNGAGKSTFVKVLTGLYAPSEGTIRLGSTPITDENREWYREHITVVFSDFFLFDKLLGMSAVDIEQRGREALKFVELDGKVALSGKTFSTTSLSQGQRKRLALVTAYLEDRPIYIFDEWAADQDPRYKDIFYNTILPQLRDRGKVVVVITHDDRYFHLGDRVVKLDEGKIVKDGAAGSYSGMS